MYDEDVTAPTFVLVAGSTMLISSPNFIPGLIAVALIAVMLVTIVLRVRRRRDRTK